MNSFDERTLATTIAAARESTCARIDRLGERAIEIPEGRTWSALMVLDHLRLLDETVTALVARMTARAHKRGSAAPPPMIELERDLSQYESGVMEAPAVPGLEPRDPAPPADVIRAEAAAARASLVEAIGAAFTVDLREQRFPHPWLGPMSAYEWIAFLAVHERGHYVQLDAIAAALAARD